MGFVFKVRGCLDGVLFIYRGFVSVRLERLCDIMFLECVRGFLFFRFGFGFAVLF